MSVPDACLPLSRLSSGSLHPTWTGTGLTCSQVAASAFGQEETSVGRETVVLGLNEVHVGKSAGP